MALARFLLGLMEFSSVSLGFSEGHDFSHCLAKTHSLPQVITEAHPPLPGISMVLTVFAVSHEPGSQGPPVSVTVDDGLP